MSVDKDKKIVSDEVDDRLDAFFSDDDWGAPEPAPPPKKAPPQAAPAPADDEDVITLAPAAPVATAADADKLGLGELKVLVLSLDWEITDQIMEKVEASAKGLRTRYQSDAVSITHLSLLELLAKYIRVKKAEAHPDSVTLLKEVYDGLEAGLSDPAGDETAKKRAALALVERFNRIKKQIAAVKGPRPKAAQVVEEAEIVDSRVATDEDQGIITAQPAGMPAVNLAAVKDEMIAALKSHLDAELSAIRAEIREAREMMAQAAERILAAVSRLSGQGGAASGEGDAPFATSLAADDEILGTLPLEDDALEAAPLDTPVVEARELPGSSDLAAEGDLAEELGLSLDDE